MNQHRAKYIAEGFVEDVGKLMNDFLELNSVEFRDFSPVWKKHYFSLIFISTLKCSEFTILTVFCKIKKIVEKFVNEIFRITTQYLLEESFYQHVGAVFVLYALFRNQISNPPVKIRLEKKHSDVIESVRIEAIKKEYKSLHYVVDYLMDHALLFVANQTLRGPLIAGLPSAHDVSINKLKEIYKDTFNEYTTSNNLVLIRDLHKQYLEEKKKLAGCASVQVTTNHEVYEEAIKGLNDFVLEEREKEINVYGGCKKAKIKAQAFQHESKNKFEVISDKLDALTNAGSSKTTRIRLSGLPVKAENREPRLRKEDRRPGRPSKKLKQPTTPPEEISDDEIDIGYLLAQQSELFQPPVFSEVKKCRTKRDPYYQVSPKRVESESDPDNSEENDESING